MAVQLEREFIEVVTHVGEPFGTLDHTIKVVTMRDPQAAPICSGVHSIGHHLDTAKRMPHKGSGKFVVVTRNKHHATPLARAAQQLLHHIVVRLWPEPTAAQLPPIHDVSHQVQMVAGMVLQKIQKRFSLTPRRAEVQIRNEHRTEPALTGKRRKGLGLCILRHLGLVQPRAQGVERGTHRSGPQKMLAVAGMQVGQPHQHGQVGGIEVRIPRRCTQYTGAQSQIAFD